MAMTVSKMAMTVSNGNDRLRKGKLPWRFQFSFTAISVSFFGNFQQTEIAVTLLGHGGKKLYVNNERKVVWQF